MNHIEAMKRALDAIDSAHADMRDEITALRQAIEQAEKQEPIGYLCENAVGHKYFRWKKPTTTYNPVALYTAPPRREWIGLTDEDTANICMQGDLNDWHDEQVIDAVEAKLKEKNCG